MRLHNLTSLSTTPQQMKNVFLLKGYKTTFLTFLWSVFLMIGVSFQGQAQTPPTISSISAQTGCGTFGPLNITVGDAETSPSNLILTAVSANTSLFPSSGITFGGAGASRTITLVAAPGQTGSSNITV
ncbi:MAG: hypothetical protein NWR10_00455, partial [Crocinitomicaceae bacterium]|nr:hypothetical protein [Crocinitomicaceae bacterium]MDP4867363.1 hypothetical protein [Crocinitomicaceae bacterium]